MSYVCGFSPQTYEMQTCGTSSKVLWKVKSKTGHSLKLSIPAFQIRKLKKQDLLSLLVTYWKIIRLSLDYAYLERRKSFTMKSTLSS